MSKISVGDRAPDFTLADANGTSHSLAAALANGPVALIFYVLDSTQG